MDQDTLKRLPVARKSSEISAQLRRLSHGHALFVHAEPGSGKSTLIPSYCGEVFCDGVTLVTEPRRLAAVGAAQFAARLLERKLGKEIGYAVRGDSRFCPETRVLYATEGVAVQLLSDRKFLKRLRCIVVDEFHERHSLTDVLLAFLRHWSRLDRKISEGSLPQCPRIVLMSATFQEEKWAQLFPLQDLMQVPGEVFPVDVEYDPLPETADAMFLLSCRICGELRRNLGHILCFLSGKGEISRLRAELLDGQGLRGDCGIEVIEVHGDRILSELMTQIHAESTSQKIFLATNIAESSLTLPGVRTVLDLGRMKQAVYHLDSRSVELVTRKADRQSLDQRAGRAGREGPGRVVRLFSAEDLRKRDLEGIPEIVLGSFEEESLLMLSLLNGLGQGSISYENVPWLDLPPEVVRAHAHEAIECWGFVDARGALTESGREASALPLPLRLCAIVERAVELAERRGVAGSTGVSEIAFLVCLLSERGLWQDRAVVGSGNGGVQPEELMESVYSKSLEWVVEGKWTAWARARRSALERARDAYERLRKWRGFVCLEQVQALSSVPAEVLAASFLAGYFDCVAQVTQSGKLRHQSGAVFETDFSLKVGEFAVICDSIRLAKQRGEVQKIAGQLLRVQKEELLEAPGSFLKSDVRTEISRPGGREKVMCIRIFDTLLYQSLVVEQSVIPSDSLLAREGLLRACSEILVELFEQGVFSFHLWRVACVDPERARNLQLALNGKSEEELMPLSRKLIDLLLGRQFGGMESLTFSEEDILSPGNLNWWLLGEALAARMAVDAPLKVQLENGRTFSVEYLETGPSIRGRVQDFYGVRSHPHVGCKPLRVALLAPNRQVAQLTENLLGFWQTSYAEVKKSYFGRYPKHYWPENPMTAKPFFMKPR